MIRRGMWVVDGDGNVGIAYAVGVEVVVDNTKQFRADLVEFHKVAKDGTTEIVLVVEIGVLTQARYRQIPESRRNLKAKQFAALGYN